MSRFPTKLVVFVSVLSISSIFVFIGWGIFVGTRTSIEAEKTNQAYRLVLDVVSVYVDRTGEWPKHWSDLRSVSPKRSGGTWKWPEDVAEIQHHVAVDFTVQCSNVGQMDSNAFSAIKQIGPNYGSEVETVTHLIEKCQKAVTQKKANAGPNPSNQPSSPPSPASPSK
jgi:hypothetical protein